MVFYKTIKILTKDIVSGVTPGAISDKDKVVTVSPEEWKKINVNPLTLPENLNNNFNDSSHVKEVNVKDVNTIRTSSNVKAANNICGKIISDTVKQTVLPNNHKFKIPKRPITASSDVICMKILNEVIRKSCAKSSQFQPPRKKLKVCELELSELISRDILKELVTDVVRMMRTVKYNVRADKRSSLLETVSVETETRDKITFHSFSCMEDMLNFTKYSKCYDTVSEHVTITEYPDRKCFVSKCR